MKNSSDTIGNRTRNLPACSAVPQSTATPRAPEEINKIIYNTIMVIPATPFKDLTPNKETLIVLCNVLNSAKIISVRGPIKLNQIF